MALSKEACARASSIEGTRNGCLGGVVVEDPKARANARRSFCAASLGGAFDCRLRCLTTLNLKTTQHSQTARAPSSELRVPT
jgi:hypothetical protein